MIESQLHGATGRPATFPSKIGLSSITSGVLRKCKDALPLLFDFLETRAWAEDQKPPCYTYSEE